SYIGPIVKKYVEKILNILITKGLNKEKFYIMQSNGGLLSPNDVIQKPVLIIESGPVAGISGAVWLSKLVNSTNTIYFDMGGTTAKAAIIRNFEPLLSREMWIEDLYYIGIPHIEVVEVGAGGGSIARIDEFGALRVGPQSAGAYPGPVCYHRGGTEPTVADADLVLGYLDEDYFLGGEYKLDKNAAINAIKEKIADKLNVSVIEAALFIYRLVNVKMANAIRLASVRRGYDPAEHVLIVSGGAGPMHAGELAQELGIKKIIVPPYPGNFSALGLLTADIRYEEFKSKPALLYSLDEKEIIGIFNELEEKVRSVLIESGAKSSEIITYWQIDMRYSGQVHDVLVTVPKHKVSEDYRDDIAKAFSTKYFETYGYTLGKELIETVTFRVIGTYPMPKPKVVAKNVTERSLDKAIVKTKNVYFEKLKDFVSTNVLNRDLIPINQLIKGPAIIIEKTSTTVVPPNATFYIDELGNIIINLNP
ncbi:MAG: hydantoinase/oxoprolinase family protein, partial [Sulfolobaceae archaeon]